MKTQLHIVPTFHHDIAYLQPEAWYRERAFAILDKAVALMEEDENYTFTVEQVYFFRDYWNERPELQERLKTYVQREQLHFAPGFWVVPDMSMPGGESLYMQATLGQAFLAESVGYAPKTAFIADCWGHHAQLPQIMTQSGYDYYTFSRCMHREWDIENFRWQGLDGTAIDTHWMSTAYAGIHFPDDAAAVNAEELHWEQASKQGILRLAERNAAKCGNERQVLPAGGDMKMPARSALAIVRELQKDPSMPSIAFSSWDRALSEIDFSEKPVYTGEFIGSLKGSFVTNIDLKTRNRQAEGLLYSLELLSVLKNRPLSFTEQWETVLKNQFHDILCGTVCDKALVQARQEFDEVATALEQKRLLLAEGNKPGWFNPHNFPVTELKLTEDAALSLSADGFGFAQATPVTPEEIPLPDGFENDYYKVTLDAQGYIRELWEKESGQKLVSEPRIPFGSLQMQVDNGDNWVEFEYPWEKDATVYTVNEPDPYDRSKLPTHPRAFIGRSGVRQVTATRLGDAGLQIVQSGSLRYWATDIPFTTTVTLSSSSPRVEYHTRITCNSRRLRLRAAFPAAYTTGRIRHQIPYGLSERTEGPQAAHMLMDYETANAGIALLNRGLPHNNTEDGIMMVSLLRSVAMEYKCTSELSYGQGETFTVDYAICPHPIGADDRLWQQALSFNRPLLESGETPLAGWAVENAFISALRPVDGDVFLRIFNGTANDKEATVRVPAGFTRWAYTDGCMRPGDGNPVDGTLSVPLPAFAVRGLRFMK